MQEWQWDKDFSGPNNLCVRINVLPLYQPKYSFETGVLVGGTLRRHIPGDLDPEAAFKLGELIMEAQHYISEKMEARSREIAEKANAEAAKEAEKRKRHSDNVERRKEENRARSQQKGGKKAS